MTTSGKVGIVVAAMLVAGWLAASWPNNEPSPTAAAAQEVVLNSPPADDPVYQRIQSMSDCTRLQAEFDTAYHNATRLQDAGRFDDAHTPMRYMDWADNRMRTLGCFG